VLDFVKILNKQNKKLCLEIIIIWNDKIAISYANIKKKIAKKLWVIVNITLFDQKTELKEIKLFINKLNIDRKVSWIILESPVLWWNNFDELMSFILPQKDVEWLHPNNLGQIWLWNHNSILPSTPYACLQILDWLFDSLDWKIICIVWHWKTVGRPLSTILTDKWATTIICNSSTKDLKSFTIKSDIIISAVWKINLITEEMVSKNSIIIDAWINIDSKWNMVWDTDYNKLLKKVKYISPVPWWVWAITSSLIFINLMNIYIKNQENNIWFNISMNDFISNAKWSWMPWWWAMAAITAINAISMISMVYSLTKWINLDKKDKFINNTINKLKILYNKDNEAFFTYIELLKTKNTTEKQKIITNNLIQKQLIDSCDIPFQICEISLEILKESKECLVIWNKNVLTDAKVAEYNAKAAILSALEPIEINLKNITNNSIIKKYKEQKQFYLQELKKYD
jgi:methylenetetrahydrofolate dehydrogenase (NADP+)/methenyltetrahydrofolate cyclohydrolase